jgi:hypothetical protein
LWSTTVRRIALGPQRAQPLALLLINSLGVTAESDVYLTALDRKIIPSVERGAASRLHPSCCVDVERARHAAARLLDRPCDRAVLPDRQAARWNGVVRHGPTDGAATKGRYVDTAVWLCARHASAACLYRKGRLHRCSIRFPADQVIFLLLALLHAAHARSIRRRLSRHPELLTIRASTLHLRYRRAHHNQAVFD